MRITVCELHDSRSRFGRDWARLVDHTRAERSELVLLPETPFAPWMPHSANFNAEEWRQAVLEHDRWELRLHELAPAAVLATRPTDFGNQRYNEGFIWTAGELERAVHVKATLTDAGSCWESVWYHRLHTADFTPARVEGIAVGFLIGAELAASEEAERYGREGVQILFSPRSTPVDDIERWLKIGRDAARRARAFQVSATLREPSLRRH